MAEEKTRQKEPGAGKPSQPQRLSRKEKEQRWLEHLEHTMPPEKYQEYLRKREAQQKQKFRITAGVCAGVLAVLLIFVKVLSPSKAPVSGDDVTVQEEEEKRYPEADITIGSTGSMLLHSPFISSYPDAEGNYDFSSIYQYITPYYSAPDFMTCEFEGTLGGRELGYSGYPAFKSPDAIVKNIRDSGVDLQMLATNHMYDASSQAFHRTMDVYEENDIRYTGVRRDEEAAPYYIAGIDGVSVGFLNYAYETSGNGVNVNGIPVMEQDWALVNTFDYNRLDAFYEEVSDRICAMREDGARFIVINLHWGTEYQLTESGIQREMAQKLCDLGVDALIGGHPHCLQPIDVFETEDAGHKMFCIFSQGNALSNQRTYLMQNEMPDGHTEDGVMVTLSLHQNTAGEVAITGIDLLPTWVYRFQDNGSKYYILPLDDAEHLAEKTGIEELGEEPQKSYERTMNVLGPGLEKARAAYKAEKN